MTSGEISLHATVIILSVYIYICIHCIDTTQCVVSSYGICMCLYIIYWNVTVNKNEKD